MYRKQYGEDRKRVASDCSSYMAYETGEVYYEKEEGTLTLMDFVQDDMDSADENAEALRQLLSDREVASLSSLYYFDGEEEKKVVDAGIIRYHEVSGAYPAIAFSLYDDSAVRKIRLSELQGISDYYDEVKGTLFDPDYAVFCIALKDQMTEMGSGYYINRFQFDIEGEMACFVNNADDTGDGDLYRVELSENRAGQPEICDQDVGTYYLYINAQGQIVYFKDYDYEKDQGDLYINGKLVDYEVYSVRYEPDLEKSFYYVDHTLKAYAGGEPEEIGEVAEGCRSYGILADGSVVCFYDYNSEYGRGDLGLYRKGKLEEIDQDVYTYQKTDDAVLYLRDYSRNYYRGDLYLYRDGESEKLDEDVVNISLYSVR